MGRNARRNGHVDRDRFFGREDERARLRALAGTGERLSLVGPPGSGKSRLAREVADATGGLYLRADLGSDDDTGDALTFALDLELPPDADASLQQEAVAQELRGYGLVFVEGPIAPVSEFTGEDTTLVRCDGRAEGEDVLELGPLSPDASLELLIDRVRQRDPHFDVDDGSRSALRELLESVDHLPRSVEQLARRLATFAPRELLELHRDRAFRPSEGAGRDQWSAVLDRIEDDAIRAVATAWHLPGGYHVSTLSEVLGEPVGDLARDVESMVDEGLARRIDRRGSGRARFRLEDSARGAISERFDEAIERTEQAVGDYWVRRAARLWRRIAGNGGASEIEALRAEQANLVHAIERTREGRPAIAAAIAHALIETSRTSWSSEREERWFDAARRLTERADSDQQRAVHALVCANQAFALRKYDAVLERLEPTLDQAPEGPVYFLAQIRRAKALHMLNDFEAARDAYADVVDTVPSDWQACLAEARMGLGWYHSTRLEFGRASDEFALAVSLAREVGAQSILTRARRGQLSAALVTGDFETARLHAEAVLEELKEHSERRDVAGAELQLADILVHLELPDEAEAVLESAGTFYDEAEFARMRGYYHFGLGKVAILRRDYDTALEHLARGRESFSDDPAAFLITLTEELARVLRDADAVRPEIHDELVEEAEAYWVPAGVSARLMLRACRKASGRDADDTAEQLDEVIERARSHGMSTHVRAGRILAGESLEPLGFEGRVVHDLVGGPGEPDLLVGPGGDWFEVGGGERVEIGNRKALPALLRTLAESGEERLDSYELAAAGWPDEELHPDTANNRVYVAIHALRKLGLDDLIVTKGRGYALAADVEVKLA